MNILVINCGSSSLKYQLIDMQDERVLCKGLVERIGIDGSRIKHEVEGKDKEIIEKPLSNHKQALDLVISSITDPKIGAVKSIDEINAVGHRVVHGGEDFAESVIITDEVMKSIEANVELAPLHNPPNIIGINACKELMPGVPQVAAFDTAFHHTIPPVNYVYAIPYEYYKKYKIRRYGFHGTSHEYVGKRAAEIVGKPFEQCNFITCHLGNGSSVTCIRHGKSIDTTMGFTPLEGLVMGTRCGDLDPAIVTYLMEKENMSIEEMNTMMNKKSGVLGISGISSDFRDLEDAAAEGNERASLALDSFENQVKKAIGAYLTEIDSCDGIIFTAGIGENSPNNRLSIMRGFQNRGVMLDMWRNNTRGKETTISTRDSAIRVMVIPTNEELMIARDTLRLVEEA
ncbi:acetate kinase [Peptoniphilus sp. GNH]|nr:acetate kinase [Peptoniphilus sp. GNH]